MAHMVFCEKLKQELPGLEHVPMPGPLGKKIYDSISAEAWALWVKHSTMVINEYRLNPSEAEAKKVLAEQLQNFLFGAGVEAPPDFVPEKS